MGKLLILSIPDHEEHIINKIMELIADEPEFIHLAPSPPQSALSFPGLEIRLKEQTVYCNGTLIALTYHEFAVLTYRSLAVRNGEVPKIADTSLPPIPRRR